MNPYVSAYKKKDIDNKQEKRRKFFSSALNVLLAMFFLSFLLVCKHIHGQHLLIDMANLKGLRKQLLTEQSVLLGEKQSVLSRARIIEYARKNLDLEFPSPERVRWIDIETVNQSIPNK